MIDKSLLAQVDSIFIHSKRLATEAFTGEFLSAFRGQGMEFSEFREYYEGDDIRLIDWNVTARMDRPFVKVHHEEREQSVILLVDVSASLNIGTKLKSKRKYTAEIAAILAYAASLGQDKVGLILFSDQIERYIPPKKGRSHVWQIIRAILTHTPKSKGTNLEAAFNYLCLTVKKQSLVFVLSDFFSERFESIKVASIKHDIIPIVIRAAIETEFQAPYLFDFADSENQQPVFIDMSPKQNRDFFREMQRNEAIRLKLFFDKSGLDSVFLLVGQNYIKPLIKLFRLRERS